MKNKILHTVRGMRDLYGDEIKKHNYIIESARSVCDLYGFEEFSTPIMEFSEVFDRSLGNSSDIITKETYNFYDKNGESVTLRPEGTAAIARAFLSNSFLNSLPFRAFYHGPMFRYERPQKGRMRQFHQVGVELIGSSEYEADIDVISAAYQFLTALGLESGLILEINSLGDSESRASFKKALIEFLESKKNKLSKDSKKRLEQNPLRILDTKDEGDKRILESAPLLPEFLSNKSDVFFKEITQGLKKLKIPWKLNPNLVRGLDYYCHTAFEFTSNNLGSQSAVLAGGRYDGLTGFIGGPSVPGVGWAAGIERIALLIEKPTSIKKQVSLIPIGEKPEIFCRQLSNKMRQSGIKVEMSYKGNLKKRLQKAVKLFSKAVVIIGDKELSKEVATVKYLDSQIQKPVKFSDLIKEFTGLRK